MRHEPFVKIGLEANVCPDRYRITISEPSLVVTLLVALSTSMACRLASLLSSTL